MNIVRWDPIREMDQFFSRPLAGFVGRWSRAGTEADEAEPTWTPTLDVSETEAEYLVRADLPAVKKEDVSVTIDNDLLTIAGERKYEKDEKSERVHRRETFRGTFSRSLSLPDNANASAIRAESRDGVLTVHVPKTKAERVKAIEIKVQ
jgi:HSP20 family protein